MHPLRIAAGTLVYALVTFPLAIVWHLVLFKNQYEQFGYFKAEPNLLLGLSAIVIQGAVLSALYPLVQLPAGKLPRAIAFAALVGTFFWTSHVLAFLAKQSVPNSGLFVVMETFYLALQFGAFALLIQSVYRNSAPSPH